MLYSGRYGDLLYSANYFLECKIVNFVSSLHRLVMVYIVVENYISNPKYKIARLFSIAPALLSL